LKQEKRNVGLLLVYLVSLGETWTYDYRVEVQLKLNKVLSL